MKLSKIAHMLIDSKIYIQWATQHTDPPRSDTLIAVALNKNLLKI